MGLKVQWSDRAELEFDKILKYWNKRNESQSYSIKLLSLVNDAVNILTEYPDSRPQTDNLSIKYKIVKDYFLYYSFDETTLYIVDVCDMRRDPDYIKSLLK